MSVFEFDDDFQRAKKNSETVSDEDELTFHLSPPRKSPSLPQAKEVEEDVFTDNTSVLILDAPSGSRSPSATRADIATDEPEVSLSLPLMTASEPLPRDDFDKDPDALVVSLDEPYSAPEQVLRENEETQPIVSKKVGPDDFEQLNVLGKGGYGKVLLVKHVRTKRVYAMKVLRKASIAIHRKDREHTLTERQILASITHPFIVPLLYAFQCDEKLYLILKYASGGELFMHMAKERMFSEDVASFYAAEIVSALQHLHGLGIIYRDLKPENIMLDAEGHVLITDFGLSKTGLLEQDGSGGDQFGRTGTVCGTIEYMAPEVVLEQQYDKAVDWWSLGVLIYDMLTGRSPFAARSRKEVMDNILKKKLVLPAYLTPDARDLISKLLRRNPTQRIGSTPPPQPPTSSAASAEPLRLTPRKNNQSRRGRKDKGSRSRSASPFDTREKDAIREHRFFKNINWNKLLNRELEPPIRPIVTSEIDTSNFDDLYTSIPLVQTPPGVGLAEMESKLLAANIRDVKKDQQRKEQRSPSTPRSHTPQPAVHSTNANFTPASQSEDVISGETSQTLIRPSTAQPISINTPGTPKSNKKKKKAKQKEVNETLRHEEEDEATLALARNASSSYRSLFRGFSWEAPSMLLTQHPDSTDAPAISDDEQTTGNPFQI